MSSKVASNLAVILVLLAAASASGCLGGKKEPTGPPTGTGPGLGRIEGRVLEEGGLPMAGAQVRIFLQNLQSTADAGGAYQIRDVPAGPARVVASGPDHASATRDLEIRAGVAHLVDFVLKPLTTPQPYNRTLTLPGKLTCQGVQGLSCADAAPGEQSLHHFAVDTGIEAILIELDWDPSLPGSAARLQMDVRGATPTACGTKYGQVEGPAPLRFQVVDGFPTRGGHQCILVRATADQAAIDQGYSLYVTLFFHSGIPGGFSAVPG